jgi:hypothetical protein
MMNTQTVSANVIRKYLLGQTSEDDRLALEEQLIADDEAYEELLIVEDELTDDYLRGQLSQTERKDFESHFLLSPSHQEKLRFAKVVRGHVANHTKTTSVIEPSRKPGLFGFLPFRNPALSYALAMALVVMVSGVAYVAWRNSQHPSSMATVTLAPGVVRSGGSQTTIPNPTNTDGVRMELLLADETPYQSYSAVLQSIDGRTITTERGELGQSANGRRVVVVQVSSALLPPGEYRVKLNALTAGNEPVDLGSYSFKVLAS